MNKAIAILLVIMMTVTLSMGVAAENNSADSEMIDFEIVGVPPGMNASSFDLKTEIFKANVTEFPDAYVRIIYDDIIVIGQTVEFQRQNNYLLVTGDVKVEQEDMVLTADQIEYYTDLDKMIGTGNLEVVISDATIWSDHMIYLNNEDKIDFTENVIVETKDAKLYGEHFVMYTETEQMEFIGSFRGVFARN